MQRGHQGQARDTGGHQSPPGTAASGDLAGGEVVLHGDFYLGNVLVHGGHVSALTDFEFSRIGPRDLELISVVRALDAERPPRSSGPPLLAWLAEDYPELFAVPDLVSRRWQYALTYTIRQTIFWPLIFWPPDRAEADGLEVTHPLHTLRRLINAPLPLPAGGLPARIRGMKDTPRPPGTPNLHRKPSNAVRTREHLLHQDEAAVSPGEQLRSALRNRTRARCPRWHGTVTVFAGRAAPCLATGEPSGHYDDQASGGSAAAHRTLNSGQS